MYLIQDISRWLNLFEFNSIVSLANLFFGRFETVSSTGADSARVVQIDINQHNGVGLRGPLNRWRWFYTHRLNLLSYQ